MEWAAKIKADLIYIVTLIKPELKPYTPIIGVGFTLLLDTWKFPTAEKTGAKNTRVAFARADHEALIYLMKHSGKSAAEVVSAALIRAKHSKVRQQGPLCAILSHPG
ncbi:MAG: hypothetical protein JWL84_1267 [Rhodospirillales bacterium]|jgi:hypothetical protein|nr:hypothetical protein [Rhodospirillales bacterium]